MAGFQDNLFQVFKDLDAWLHKFNEQAFEQGARCKTKQEVRIVGQVALLLADLPVSFVATRDLDVASVLDFDVQKKLSELLLSLGIALESDGHLIWMPEDTKYQCLYESPLLHVAVAEPEFVIQAKEKFKRKKDEDTIQKFRALYPRCKK